MQVKAIAEAVAAELKARLKERDAALEALEANMAQDKVCPCVCILGGERHLEESV